MKIMTLLSTCIILMSFSCKSKAKDGSVVVETNNVVANTVLNSVIDVYDFEGFEPFLNQHDDKIYVINFWATWCAPCVKELPHFETLHANYASKNVEVILVSLDFPHLYESNLKPFIKKNKIKSKVIALDDADANRWISKVDKNWTGSIPATLIYRNENSEFYEQSFNYEALEKEVKQFIN